MSDIDRIMLEVEKRYQEETRKQEEALNEKALADEMKAEAIKKEKAAKAALKELEVARAHAMKAQESYNAFRESNGEVVNSGETGEVSMETATENRTNGDFGSGLLIGGITVALIATGAWALSRDSLTGEVRAASWFKGEKSETEASIDETTVEESTVQEEAPGFVYDYENNVVVIPSMVDPNAAYAYDFEADASQDTRFVDEYGNEIEVVTEAGQAITNPVINEELPANAEYVELTTERFEELTTSLIQKYESLGLDVSREDIIKYVMIRNLDKLRQDNNELVNSIIGSQEPLEVFADADHVIDAIMTYNLLYFDKYQNTDGFLSAADGVFDEVQRARVLEIERRVYEIGAYYQDEATYNELTYTLLRDMINPLNPISELEDGVSYGVEWIDMYMVRSTFGTDRYITLNDVNSDLVKYFVSFAGDGEEYENNALVNGNVRNINALLTECDVKTLTK